MPSLQTFRAPAVALLLAVVAVQPALCAKKAPPAAAAASYPAHDTHPNEHVTIGAEPFETRAKADFFRLDYVGHSVLPIRVVIQNDADQPLDLKDVRIQFVARDGTRLPAATPDELNRRLFRLNDIKARHIPGTPITYHKTPVDKKILDDDKDFSFAQTTVPAHSTASGFLFYDIEDLPDPAMRGAELYLKMIHVNDSKHTELFGFTLPLDATAGSTAKLAEKKSEDASGASTDSDTAAPSNRPKLTDKSKP